jgi:hypothetical protein
MSRNWLAVASAEHVEIGRSAGFMQVCHGKASPLRRVQPGDRVVYYSPNRLYTPSHALRGKDRLQAFTAIGTVRGALYQADMGFGFQPFRRDVAWHDAQPAPLAALQEELAFTQEKNWGYRLRQGLVEISDADMTIIAAAMLTFLAFRLSSSLWAAPIAARLSSAQYQLWEFTEDQVSD